MELGDNLPTQAAVSAAERDAAAKGFRAQLARSHLFNRGSQFEPRSTRAPVLPTDSGATGASRQHNGGRQAVAAASARAERLASA